MRSVALRDKDKKKKKVEIQIIKKRERGLPAYL